MIVYYKMRQILWQNATVVLLQNATDVYYNWFNASGFLLQNATVLLQNVTVIANCNDVIRKCDVYYKLWQHKLLPEIF